jgi:uncharacterized membrane protein YjjP (DUF1212 family)
VADRRVVESPTADATAVEFLLRFTRVAHRAGYPTADLEERILALASSLGLGEAQVSATPTIVEVSLGKLPHQRSYTLRVQPTTVELNAISRLDDLIQDVLDDRLDPAQALAALTHIQATPLERKWPIMLAAYALAGAALTPVLGGGWSEAAAAAVVGLVVGGIALPARRTARLEPMVAPVAAIAASFCAVALVHLGMEASPDIVTLAAIVTFLPGMTLTTGMRELAAQHLQSGVANTASALVQLLGLAFGVGIGRSVATSWFGVVDASTSPEHVFVGVQLLAAVAAGLAFSLTLRARSRDALLMSGATVLALGANEIGAAIFGTAAAVFVATLTVGVVGGLLGSVLRRSSLVFIVPGVLMLVPGSAGFNSIVQLLTEETISGINAGFDTFLTAMSIAYGLMVATVVLPRRFTQVAPHTAGVAGTSPS